MTVNRKKKTHEDMPKWSSHFIFLFFLNQAYIKHSVHVKNDLDVAAGSFKNYNGCVVKLKSFFA